MQITIRLLAAAIYFSAAVWCEDLTIHLPPKTTVSQRVVRYQCDAQGPRIGVPAGPFPVDYINGGGNSLAVVPISGNPLIFSAVISGSGARYNAQQFTWWEAQGGATLYADSISGKVRSVCHPVQPE